MALQSVMVRRLKKDCLDLPKKSHILVTLDLSPTQRTLYDTAREELRIEMPGAMEDMELENGLTKGLRLKQITNTTAEIPGYKDESTKLDKLVEIALEVCTPDKDREAEPLVVFTQFLITQACAIRRLEAVGLTCFILNGSVPKEKRVDIIKGWGDFRHSGKRAVLVAMCQVGGTGFNMTQASTAVFIDRLYVPKLNEQCEDRLDRIGQTKPVRIMILVCRNTIEQRIEQILMLKSKLNDKIVEDSAWKRQLLQLMKEEVYA